MRVYLASGISQRSETLKKANELRAIGIEVTSRWLEETGPNLASEYADVPRERMSAHAVRDLQDIQRADLFVLVASPRGHTCRGCGRHFETGYAYANGKPVLIVGEMEHVFHALPSADERWAWEGVRIIKTWRAAKSELLRLATAQLPAWLVAREGESNDNTISG